jgi:hypothetical protein
VRDAGPGIRTVAEFSADERPSDAGLRSLPPASVNWSDSGVAHDSPERAESMAMKAPTKSGTTIVTLTMNPALDITTDADRVIPTDKMRCGLPRYHPGGGGINGDLSRGGPHRRQGDRSCR